MEKMSKTEISGVKLNSYIFNASGPNNSNLDELKIISESGSAAVMMKSCTIEPRKGNEEPRYSRLPFGSIQCMGLPNLGYREYVKFASHLKQCNKPIIASVAGLCTEDYQEMVKEFQKSEVDLIEVNLSCPNLAGKPPVAYDLKQVELVLNKIMNLGSKPVGLKLPTYYTRNHYERMAELIQKYGISFITCINSLGDTLVINSEKESTLLKPKRGFGALSGEYIKPLALANVRIFYELLKNKVSVIGVGGIKSGSDVFEFLLAGADAVQVGTTFEKEGFSCFERLNREFEKIIRKKGYDSIQEIKGKLRFL